MKCSKCGNEIQNGNLFCSVCGLKNEPMNSMNQNNNMNNGYNQNMNNNQSFMNNNQQIMNNQQMYNNGFNNMDVPKQNKRMVVIIIGAVVAIGVIVALIVILTGGSKPSSVDEIEKNYKQEQETEIQDLTSNSSITYTSLKDGGYLFTVQNNSNKTIFPECTVDIYNNSTLVGTKEVIFTSYIPANSKGYGYLAYYDIEKLTFNKIVPKLQSYPYYYKTYDNISIKSEKKEDYLSVSVTNNNNVTLSFIEIQVLFYDASGNIIAYEEKTIYKDIPAWSTNTVEIDYPMDKDYNELNFSKYEIIAKGPGDSD